MDPIIVQENKSSVGSIVGIILIVVILVIGGLYFWGQRIVTNPENTEAPVSKSDDVDSIQAELKSTNSASADFSSVDSQ